MVNLTRIYTRTGDAGSTRLGDMSETSKTDLRLAAYADVDEANAHLGVALAQGGLGPGRGRGADPGAERPLRRGRRLLPRPWWRIRRTPRCGSSRTTSTGSRAGATRYNEELPNLRSFMLNGGTPGGRPAARRAHRRPPRRACRLGGVRRARGDHERARDQVPQPALRPALHPGSPREQGAGRRAVDTRWGAFVPPLPRQRRPSALPCPRRVGAPGRRARRTRRGSAGPRPRAARDRVPTWSARKPSSGGPARKAV